MRRRSRTRRVLRWIGTITCVLIVGLTAVSVLYYCEYGFAIGQANIAIFGSGGCVSFLLVLDSSSPGVPSPRSDLPPVGLVTRRCHKLSWAWQIVVRWNPNRGPPDWNRRLVRLPLWMPFVLVAIPTAFLWWRDRRLPPPGHCQRCGYDLTGNVSGRCPECGTAFEREGETG